MSIKDPSKESLLVGLLGLKFAEVDSDLIQVKWKEIESQKGEKDIKKIEDLLKITPGFTLIDMINFAEYCRNGFTQYEWEEKDIIDHLLTWISKTV